MLLFGISIVSLVGLLLALGLGFTLHEYAHAWTAYRLGDRTPLFHGRLTLNPRSHIDPLGLILALLFGFGWARPVPFNPMAFYPEIRRSSMLVALAGPVSNLLIAIVFGILMRMLLVIDDGDGGIFRWLIQIVAIVVFFNIVLLLFNLIPLFPLDGWRVMLGLVPTDVADDLAGREQEATFVLMMVIMIGLLIPGLGLLSILFNLFGEPLFELLTGTPLFRWF